MSKFLSPSTKFTQVPNIVFNYWIKMLRPTEFVVLACICCKTFGFGKKYNSISISDFEKSTSLSRSSIFNSIRSLCEKNVIIRKKSKTEFGDNATNEYCLNVTEP